MALSKTQVSELYAAIFNRASEGEGNSYWQDLGLSASESADAMLETSEAQAYFGDALEEDRDFIEQLYANTLNKTSEQDPEGIDYWVDQLESGSSRGEVVAALVASVGEYANSDDPQTAKAYAQFQNRVVVSDYTADNLQNAPADYDSSLNFGNGLTVTSDVDTVVTAKQNVDGIEDVEPDEPEDPGVPGETFGLTTGTDNVAGTEDNDTFMANLGQGEALGGVSNTLSSADVIDGEGGYDTLEAQLVSEFVGAGNGSISVQPTTSNVEDVQLEARSVANAGDNAGTVTFDAKNMTDVEKIGSYFSDGDLKINNVNTLTSDGEIRNTEDMTVVMDHTSNFDSINDASDLTVLFDDDYLLSGQTSSISQANYWLLDEDSEDYANEPLLNIERNGVELNIDGEPVVIELDQEVAANADTWATYAQALQARIDQMVANGNSTLEGISVVVDENNTDSTFNDFGVEVTIPAITLLDEQSRDLVPTGFITPENATGRFDIYGDFDNVAAEQTDKPIAVDVELEKVGRAGEGGNLTIGGKSQQIVDGQANGIEVFNIDVLGTEAQPSNLGSIQSTNGTLETINIATGDEFAGDESVADLVVRGADENNEASNPFGENVDMVNATQFEGDLTIGTEGVVGSYAQNLGTLNATGGGDVTFNGNYDDGANHVITTGAGDDVINLVSQGELDGSATVNTGGGSDVVNGGAVEVTVDGGAGNDAIYVDNTGTMGRATVTTGQLKQASGNGDEDPNYGLLFGRAVTVTVNGDQGLNSEVAQAFAHGFEGRAIVQADSIEGANRLTNQDDLNDAVLRAVDNSEVLSDLVDVTVVDGELEFVSKIDGDSIDVKLNVSESNWSKSDRDTLESEYQEEHNDSTIDLENGVGSTGQAPVDLTGGTDAQVDQENSVSLSSGQDTVVLSSAAESVDTIVVDEAFGTSSIVNFSQGEDQLDFTAYLDGMKSTSGSEESQVRIDTNYDNDSNLDANEVNFQQLAKSEDVSFSDLSASNLLNVFDGLTANTDYTNSSGNVELVEGDGSAIVMVENEGNEGQYKMFDVSFNGTDDNFELTSSDVELIGTADFGASLDVSAFGAA